MSNVSKKLKVLIGDDSEEYGVKCAQELREMGFFCIVRPKDGGVILEAVTSEVPDVVVADLWMPGLDAIELMKKVNKSSKSKPAFIITAPCENEFALRQVMQEGAAYYLVKPFHMQELLAVVRVMARKYTDTRTNVYTIADLSVDVSAHTVVRAGRVIELTSREYALLEYMIRNKGVVLSRERIENNLWNYDYEGGTNVVDVYVGYLRKKIDTGFSKKLIHTVWGTGWVLRED